MALNDVPQAAQSLAQTQNPIRQNFSTIDTAFTVDHVDYNDPNQGQHDKVTLLPQGSAPAFAAGTDGIYCLPYNNGTNTLNEVFVHKQTLASTQNVPFTSSVLSSTAPLNDQSGWTYLPSGIILRWDGAAVIAGTNTFTLVGSPAFTNLFAVIVSSGGNPGPAVSLIAILSNTQFTVNSSGAGTCRFLAIGW